jgi:hypothetical protein
MSKRKAILMLLGLGLVVIPLLAAGHNIVLTWTPPSDAVAGETYTVYRGVGACAGNPTMSSLAAAISASTYTDTAVTAGSTYCYYVESVVGAQSSVPSNTAGATVPIYAPTGLTVTAN